MDGWIVAVVDGLRWVVAVGGYLVLVDGSGWLGLVEEGSWRTEVVFGTLQLLGHTEGWHTAECI